MRSASNVAIADVRFFHDIFARKRKDRFEPAVALFSKHRCCTQKQRRRAHSLKERSICEIFHLFTDLRSYRAERV